MSWLVGFLKNPVIFNFGNRKGWRNPALFVLLLLINCLL